MNVIFVGRLIFAKGCQDLIEATRSLGLPLFIVGEGPYKQTLMDMSANAKHDVFFYGELDRQGVFNALKMATIFVNPSYSEGLPTSVMEAAAVGLPIIATNVGGTNEIITHQESGLLYEPHDIVTLTQHLQWCIRNPEQAKLMGLRAQEAVCQKFNWAAITEQWEHLLQKVTS